MALFGLSVWSSTLTVAAWEGMGKHSPTAVKGGMHRDWEQASCVSGTSCWGQESALLGILAEEKNSGSRGELSHWHFLW